MKHRIVVGALSVALATLGPVAPLRAGPAGSDACAATGTMSTSSHYDYSTLLLNATNASFFLSLDLGVCAFADSFQAFGTLSGWCDKMSGRGTATDGKAFAFVGSADVVVEGEAVGNLTITPNALQGDSCAFSTVGANSFLVTGELVLKSCSATLSQQTQMPQNWTVYHHKCV